MAIYFLAPDYTFPSGGVRVIYRHVDILNANGIEAYVLHRQLGHRCTWFENDTPIVYWDAGIKRRIYDKLKKSISNNPVRKIFLVGAPTPTLEDTDILVLPEIYGPEIESIAVGIPKVILNQGCYLTFRGYSLKKDRLPNPYIHPDIKGVLINSEDGLNYLNYVFPTLKPARFRLNIDKQLFAYSRDKKRQICYTDRKGEQVVQQVVNILKVRDSLAGFTLVPFSGMTQEKVAQLMRESAIFLSLGQNEGFGLPPAEAMACGSIVVGFHAGGGREFMKSEFSFPIECGDILGFAQALEGVTTTYDARQEQYLEMGRRASEFIHSTYSPENEEADLLAFWKGILGRAST